MINLLIILLSLLAAIFFSGMEVAFLSGYALSGNNQQNRNDYAARLLQLFVSNKNQFMATVLSGNILALFVYGVFMANALAPFLRQYTGSTATILFFQVIIGVFVVLLTAEFIPKTFFANHAKEVLRRLALPMSIFYFVLYPFTSLAIHLSRGVVSMFIKAKTDFTSNADVVFAKTDLDNFLREIQSGQLLEYNVDNEIKIFQNALDFSNVKIRECMVPRTEIEAIEINKSIDEVRERFIQTGFSKILVYQGNIDNVIGYFHSIELFKNPKTIKSKLHKISIVTESMPAQKMLSKFIKEHKSIAVVVDEFGGTSGVVTVEDVIEEIFGEIEDEHDSSEFIEKQVNPNEYVFSGRLEIDYLNEKYNLQFPESDDYETLAGYIVYYFGSIPKLGDRIQLEHYEFQITKASKTRIELVNLIILKR